jgi:ABC-type Mn2+/Zn2+ transport system ATPase subunit
MRESQKIGITAQDVTVTYRNGTTALRNASFDIPTGTITALVGVNGAGKSTLFKALMGFVPAAKGKISILACDEPILLCSKTRFGCKRGPVVWWQTA